MSTDQDNRLITWLAIGLVAVAVIYFFCVTFVPVPAASRDFANIILGVMTGGAFMGVINFYFGSSKSGRDKDASIKAMAENAPRVVENHKANNDDKEQPPQVDN